MFSSASGFQSARQWLHGDQGFFRRFFSETREDRVAIPVELWKIEILNSQFRED
jgi:lipid-A-disaccharide synthase-like uncharacterized protein